MSLLATTKQTEEAIKQNAEIQKSIKEKYDTEMQQRAIKVNYSLQKDIDWFGQTIKKGTEYRQINSDWWYPIIKGNLCPSKAVDFYTVKENPSYFEEISLVV